VGQTFSVNLDVAGHRISEVSLTWGLLPGSEIRSSAATYGTDIEVPAVIELLDLVAAGTVTAEQARAGLENLAAAINEEQDRRQERLWENMEQARSVPQPRAETAQADSRWVYVVAAEDNPKIVKIGVAGDIERRIKSLQTGAAATIILRWSTRGGFPLERHLHEQFQERRLSGEWFDFRDAADPVEVISQVAGVYSTR
jgi:hypothetical protein